MEPMHFFRPYYRPRYMGGDTQHALCRAPRFGWAGEDAANLPMTVDRSLVRCPACLRRLGRATAVAKPKPLVVRPRRNNDAKHLRLVWQASQGLMFPACVIQPLRRAA